MQRQTHPGERRAELVMEIRAKPGAFALPNISDGLMCQGKSLLVEHRKIDRHPVAVPDEYQFTNALAGVVQRSNHVGAVNISPDGQPLEPVDVRVQGSTTQVECLSDGTRDQRGDVVDVGNRLQTLGEVAQLLGVIEGRCTSGQNGARWQVDTVHALESRGMDRWGALHRMTQEYIARSHTNAPVHTWDIP